MIPLVLVSACANQSPSEQGAAIAPEADEVDWDLLEDQLEELSNPSSLTVVERLAQALRESGWFTGTRSNSEKLRLCEITYAVIQREWVHRTVIQKVVGNPHEQLARTVPHDLSRLGNIPNVLWLEVLSEAFTSEDSKTAAYEAAREIATALELFLPVRTPSRQNSHGYGEWAKFIKGTVPAIPSHDLSERQYFGLTWAFMSNDPEGVTAFLYQQLPHLAPHWNPSVIQRLEMVGRARHAATAHAEAALRRELGKDRLELEDRAALDRRQFIPDEVKEIVYSLAREGGWPGQLYAFRMYRSPEFHEDPGIVEALRDSNTDYAQRLLERLPEGGE